MRGRSDTQGPMFLMINLEDKVPEQILKAMLLQALYSIPSDIKRMQPIDLNLLFRWFLGLGDAPAWTRETAGFGAGYDDGTFLDEVESDLGVVPHVPIRRGPIKATDAAGEVAGA